MNVTNVPPHVLKDASRAVRIRTFTSIRAFTLSTKSAVDYDECRNCEAGELMLSARSTGLEPVTQGLEIPCSIQLSYERGWLIRLYEWSGRLGMVK